MSVCKIVQCSIVQEGMYNELYNKEDIIVQLGGQIIVQEEKGPCPGSLPSQPRSPFALHSFYRAVTPFVTILIKIIINNKITTLEKDNEPTSLGRLPPLSASPRLNSNPCFLHLIIISPSTSSHHVINEQCILKYYRTSNLRMF